MVRHEVDRYLNERNNNNTQALPEPQQQSQSGNPLALIINSIENQLSKEDLDFLMSNTHNLPFFFGTKEGNRTVLNFVNAFKKT